MLTKYIDELKHSYELKKEIIKQRIHEFENIYKLGDEAIFIEL